MKTFGIDVSKWQGENFDFKQAINEGVNFAILRGSYGCYKDSLFDKYYNTCKSLNLPVGVYLYSIATTVDEAKAEARYLINNVLKGKTFEYPIYMDVEDEKQRVLGAKKLTDIVIAFCETLESAGYYVGIYASMWFFKSYLDESRLTAYDKWVAQWDKKCTYDGAFGMWQFGGETNNLRKNIIAGVVCDQDYAYKDYPAIIKAASLNGFKGSQTVAKKTAEEIAAEVIKGVWGNGEARRKALTEAGYNYAEVQAIVEKLLGKKSVTEIAREVIAGKWGNGSERKRRLIQAGYNYAEVQKKVNELL